MSLLLPTISLIAPNGIAKWLFIAFATIALILMSVPAFSELRVGQPDVLIWSIPILAWIVGPAATAALLVTRVKSRAEAWLCVVAEVGTVVSTVWLTTMVFLDGRPQNAQAGVGMILLPILQFAFLISYASAVIGTAMIIRGCAARRLGSSPTPL